MKKTLLFAFLTCVLPVLPIAGQPAPAARPAPPPPTPHLTLNARFHDENEAPELQLARFDLDFKGGTPGELVEAIQKQTGKPLNAIIRDDCVNDKLPALKMRSVNVSELFIALGQATASSIPVRTGPNGAGNYQIHQTASRFSCEGAVGPDSIWYYQSPKPPIYPDVQPKSSCRFYQISGYLDRWKVDDIITAIETGWKMMDDGAPNPSLKFHQETKLLIAVGVVDGKLQVIDDVLKQLKDVGKVPPSSEARKL